MSGSRRLNVDMLRHRIDRGSARDKVAYSDPALAPLGTDEEAAGTPPTRQQLDMDAAQLRRPPETGPRVNRSATLAYLLSVVAVGAGILAVVLFA